MSAGDSCALCASTKVWYTGRCGVLTSVLTREASEREFGGLHRSKLEEAIAVDSWNRGYMCAEADIIGNSDTQGAAAVPHGNENLLRERSRNMADTLCR